MPGLSLCLHHHLTLALECSVCEQFYLPDEVGAEDFRAVTHLVGAKRFHKCCCCHQEVSEGGDDDYKIRFAAWERKRQQERREASPQERRG